MTKKYSENYLKRAAASMRKYGMSNVVVGKLTSEPIGKLTSSINPYAGVKNTISGKWIIEPKKPNSP